MNPDETLLGVATPGGDICGAQFHRCQCLQGPNHEPPHSCDCGGSWTGEGDNIQPVTMPHVALLDELGIPQSAAGLVYGGVRRGGIKFPTSDGGSDG